MGKLTTSLTLVPIQKVCLTRVTLFLTCYAPTLYGPAFCDVIFIFGLIKTLYWRDDKKIGEDSELLAYLEPVLTKTKAQTYINETSNSQTIKDELSRVTKEAFDSGAFGSPWIIVKKQDGSQMTFFGSDRMEAIAFFLGKPYHGVNPNPAKI
jgi:2-hydroxychromene-2-carboxylate isomerase